MDSCGAEAASPERRVAGAGRLSRQEARSLIAKHGDDREALNAPAKELGSQEVEPSPVRVTTWLGDGRYEARIEPVDFALLRGSAPASGRG